MSVPTIAIYASPPGGICSTQSTSGGILDSDFNPRHHSSSTSTSAPNQRSISGGISCLFSSSSLPSPRHIVSAPCSSAFAFGDQRSDDLTSYSDFGYSYKSVSHGHNQSPAAPALMLQAPVTREKFASSSPSKIPTHNDQPIDLGELAFSMEDEFVESSETANCYEEYATEMLSGARAEHTIFNDEFVTKAFYEAEKAHRGQLRASGDPYLRHCVETALLLANVGADATVVATGLLHDTVDDCSIDHGYIARTLDAQVADLVDGVTKLSQLSKLARENNTADKIVEADRLHTLFLAITDTRAVLVKLADRLHNMMTLESLPFVKQQRFAKETMEIYAPLANRLGISSWKQQLENLCFKHLNPEQYWEISSKLATKLDKAVFIAYSKEKLEYALKRAGVSYHDLSGRHKSLFSIYAKMRKKKLNMNQIHDIHGLRLIVENEEDCYKALDIVHHLWPRCESSRRTKDYIARPKFNGYRSLHTVVMSHDEAPLEVQIRTLEMHHQAEFGFAAHWRYKEGKHMYSKSVVQMVEWARWVVKCHCLVRDGSVNNTLADLSSSSFSYKPTNMHTGPVFITVLENDKMSVEEFPAHSTLMDLFGRLARASSRWSGYSLAQKEELRPRLNHQPVELLDRFRKLMMGDIVELTPQIPVKSLSGYRDEIQRMYDANVVSASCEIPCTT